MRNLFLICLSLNVIASFINDYWMRVPIIAVSTLILACLHVLGRREIIDEAKSYLLKRAARVTYAEPYPEKSNPVASSHQEF